ncbi:arylsulfatase [Novosphingobium album (ex Hu et al. 2023)]|uniref:Arylsulfatase n=1 Tax=Novosphingobium album (ex Hu et al. 2023) TaxID=2930093 RepID=A0ABT0B276_9SPHN|nr:arylsulfatase [Novosphingobium album (ex Hu et al. 2023)]MCJ2179168.1 arylsulfatase [Novosphingobium album (ex Hu et al. 2023)]
MAKQAFRRLKLAATGLAIGTCAPAMAQADRTVLPIPRAPFTGKIADSVLDSTPAPSAPVRAPQGAPNVLLFMSDDVGFAMSSAFGGPVSTPNFDRLAQTGERFNRFNTTGICSPSRAALLTGRNHHNAGVGWLSDLSSGFPGYNGRVQPDTATIAQILRLNGYNTAMFGKHHNVPAQDRSEAGPFDAWPTGLGFEYFYGFPNGDSDQYSPELYRGISRVDPDEGKGKMLDERLADDMIRWIHNQKAGAPNKPFLAYLSPGSAHAPHQVPPEWIARFKGKFDMGWDQMRVESWRRQLAMGIIPKGTRLTPRPADIPAWNSLTPQEKAYHARTMEVAAAMLAFQDAQLGRVLDELQRMGQLDNTLIAVVLGDNGASGEAGPPGTINELRGMDRIPERKEWMLANIDKLGGPETYGNYAVGWAWAMNTPFRWVKQYADMLGGIRNGMIVNWAGHVAKPGSICGEFSHLIDITPTILDAAGLPAPKEVLGTMQKPMDGESLLPALQSCPAEKPRTQYFEITGKMGLYHDGWFLSGEDGRPSWENLGPGGPNPTVTWTLYDLSKDFSQSTDVSAKYPDKLEAMKALFHSEGEKNDVFPIDHRFGMARAMSLMQPDPRKHFDFWGKDVSIPAIGSGPTLMARPFTLKADLKLDSAQASGAVVSLGSKFGGWSLYLDKGHPAFVWARSTDPQETFKAVSDKTLPQGVSTLTMQFQTKQPGGPAKIVLSAGGEEYAQLDVPVNYFSPSGNGESLDIGRDLGVPVTKYVTPHGMIEGDVPHVTVDYP